MYVLLYADDIIVMAETSDQLQPALNSASEYCNLWLFKVIIDKTKIIVFSKAKVRKHQIFKL